MSEESVTPKYAEVSSTSNPSGRDAPSSTGSAINLPPLTFAVDSSFKSNAYVSHLDLVFTMLIMARDCGAFQPFSCKYINSCLSLSNE